MSDPYGQQQGYGGGQQQPIDDQGFFQSNYAGWDEQQQQQQQGYDTGAQDQYGYDDYDRDRFTKLKRFSVLLFTFKLKIQSTKIISLKDYHYYRYILNLKININKN